MGGPPNTFTGATQPIPVGGDGSVQAGLPDANTGRDTRGVVNKYSTLRSVSPHAMRLRVRCNKIQCGGVYDAFQAVIKLIVDLFNCFKTR